jgi:hypothetical protein
MRRTLTLLSLGLSATLIAVVVAVAIPAEGAPNGGGPGDPLLLSRVNQAGPMTVLKTNGGFRILAKNPKRPPLMIYTPDSMPPLDVSSTARVDNLNADLLDALDSTAFSPAGHTHDGRYYTEAESDARFVSASGLSLPMAAYAGGNQLLTIGSNDPDTIVRSVSLTPPADGTVIVSSTVNVFETKSYLALLCSITTGDVVDPRYHQIGGSDDYFNGGSWQYAGTRGFTVEGGASFTANLVCRDQGGIYALQDSVLTAIFIPN